MASKILVLSSIPPRKPTDTLGEAWADLANVTWTVMRAYCARHGYDFHGDVSDLHELVRSPLRDEKTGEAKPIYYKIKFLLFKHFLDPQSCGREYDAVVWIDADALITRPDIPLEKFLNSHPGTEEEDPQMGDIVLTRDVNGLHATVIMMRRTALTLGFAYANAEAGMRYYMRDYWSDQRSMRMMLQTPPYQGIVWYHSVQTLCAMPPDTYLDIPQIARKHYEWTPDSFSLHLSALSLKTRIAIAKEYTEGLGLCASS